MKRTITTLAALLIFFNTQAGELFVKVNNQSGSYYATFDNQTQYNQTGIFRFFEVSQSQNFLVIRQQNNHQIVASLPMQIPYNQRWIGEISAYGQFQLITSQTIQYISWYAEQNPFVQPLPTVCPTPTPFPNGNVQQWNAISDADYHNFLQHLQKESFDNGKLASASNFVKNRQLKASQIAGIANEFTFDSDRLKWAKYAYDFCYDKGNYYQLQDAFTFDSSYDELQKYIATK